jgi:pyruvate ferredoxin oxidoreductase alpha subunit
MTCANRAVGAPINIFSDHQDTLSLRDAGWIQLYVESNQEAVDTTIQAYRIAEVCELPVMVCMDGFFLTHTFEPVDVPDQAQVDEFLPPFEFARTLDPARPATLGGGSEPDNYLEYRQAQHESMTAAASEISDAATEFALAFGRDHGALVDGYRLDDAERIVVVMGSVMGAVRDTIDGLRDRGQNVGALRLRCVRPFPGELLVETLSGARRIAVLEKAVSPGGGGIIVAELRAAFQRAGSTIPIDGFVGGLGGRDLTPARIEEVLRASAEADAQIGCRFVDSKHTIEEMHHGPT